ncbi:bifunctional diguanylate cyclase/phosphodiesterase [Mycobacterium sp. 852002-10029_SCH5224772]|uniref:bifunctional diguanylate cyclase/phosphodiesterase n=1 Tax=Mycobacterium sp. 852002-10029_SCH5224772 TaxID=1834083 RepID=UPI000801AA9D|nr:bifunctional diguanylate cyclase/phosphodiesterase [Mycobacterium sp. 852002-10029_SCH5224772]OBF06956.1 diguanylate phosphodiesterase [Mycobacterium sp. 852002-10029_SCH5224772]
MNPWRRSGVPAPAGWLLAGVYGTAGVLILLSSFYGWRGAYGSRPVNEFVIAVCLVITAACAAHTARSSVGRQRYGWLALVTALLGWGAGEIIWAVYDVRPEYDHAVHPAVTEYVLMLWPIGATASLILLSLLSRHTPRRLLLDGLIVATSLFVIAWVFVVEAQLRERSGTQLVTLGEVFADIVQLTIAILMLSRARPGDRPSRSLLAGGIATICGADLLLVFHTGLGSYHTGEVNDLVRVAGLATLALAALSAVHAHPAPASPDEIEFRARLWLPYLPLIVAAAVGWGHAAGNSMHEPVIGALGILVAAVLARQFVVLIENQDLLSEVAREAYRDHLTGLANRALFLHRLQQAVARRHPNGTPIAVLCLDLDNFKAVNDALGHPAGDELLVRVAGRLTATLGESGTVARLGGDEFAAIIEASVKESQAAAHRILDAFSGAVLIDGIPITVRPSIGFTVCTGASACTVDQLMRHADLAMYAAKREGGQCIRSFMPDLPMPYAFPPPPSSKESAVASGVGGNGSAEATPQPPVSGVVAATSSPPSDAADAGRRPPGGIQAAFAVLAIGVTAFAVSTALHPASGHGIFSATTLYSVLNAVAAGLIALRAYHVPADRLAWSLIAAGMAFSAAGDVVYALWVPDGRSPSVADPVYLAYYPFVYAGLLLLMRARFKRLPIPVQLDSVVCALTLAAVAAALTEGPIRAATLRTPATVWMGLAYPWVDLVLLALAAGMLPILGWRNEIRWPLLVAGLVLFAVADGAYMFQTSAGTYRAGSLLDVCWPASSLLIAMASWARSSPTAPLPRHRFGPYITPVASSVVALGVIVLAHYSRSAATLAALSLVVAAGRFSLTFRDVSLLQTHAKHAMTDELTALPNRHSLATALTALPAAESPAAASMPSRAHAPWALLLLSLSDFHEITDSIGREFGDELLCHIANRLSGSVRRDDVLARVGYDQFAVLLADGASLTAASAQAGRLLEALSEPIALDPITVQVEGRIAIALCPDHCDDPQELLSRAETAMSHAKSARSKIAVYDSSFEIYRDNDPNLIEELRTALFDTDELKLHYQPKIDGRDGSVHSVEAVLRWQHPRRGTLLPEEFLSAAERAGLMRKISNRTLSMALKQVRCWREQGITLTVAVNLSTTNLLDIELVGTVERLLANHDLPADALILEITESALVDSVRSRNTVTALQRLGIRISLDDYGTGWSSLARLQEVSVDELKLDRIFVSRLAYDARSVAIVRSTVALASSLGADLVAEGVENEATLNALRRYGCMITQGFVHSPPLPPEELQDWIASHAPTPHSSRSNG